MLIITGVTATAKNKKMMNSFHDCVQDIVESPVVLELKNWNQHMHVNRFQHSVNVAYYSFLICQKFRLNSRSAARGGLLHDLYFYDYKASGIGVRHLGVHPAKALENAECNFKLTPCERDIILKHMWPCSKMPMYPESWIVTMTDKFSAIIEVLDFLRLRAFSKFLDRHSDKS